MPYEGREQTWLKHYVLKKYLERFAHIIGSRWNAITYVDCFAGPWKARDAQLVDTSFSIALQELRRAKSNIKQARNIDLDIGCYFLEKDWSAFKELDAFRKQNETDVTIRCRNATFEDSVEDILEFITKRKNAFSFIFIDPTGWKGIPLARLTPLLQWQPGEALVNFMTSHIKRFVGTEKDSLARTFQDLFGPGYDLAGISQAPPDADYGDYLAELYAENLRRAGCFDFVARAFVLNPKRNETQFHLIYCTRHEKGLDVFKKAEKDGMKGMEERRVKRKEGNQTFMEFDEVRFENSSHYEQLRRFWLEHACEEVSGILREKRRVLYDEVLNTFLQHPLVWQDDLDKYLKMARKEGRITIDGMRPQERKLKRNKRVFLDHRDK